MKLGKILLISSIALFGLALSKDRAPQKVKAEIKIADDSGMALDRKRSHKRRRKIRKPVKGLR